MLLGMQSGQAATDTWIGSTTVNWNVQNGFSAVPATGDALVFAGAGAAGTTLNNNLTTLSFNIAGISFNAGAPSYTINGNDFALTGDVLNRSITSQTINDNITMATARTFTLQGGGGNITLGGNLSGAGGISTSGSGILALTGATSYTGATTIGTGTTLSLNSAAASTIGVLANNGALTIAGGGTLTTGNLTSGAGSTITNTSGTLSLGTITGRNTGSTVDFSGTLSSISTTTADTAAGAILGGYATVNNGTAYAAVSGGKIIAFTGGTALPTSPGSTPTVNYTLAGSQTETGTNRISSLALSSTGSNQTLSLGTSNLVFNYSIANGGILYTGGGNNVYNITGTNVIGVNGGEIIVSDVAGSTLNIAAPVVDTAGGSGKFTKTGAGTLVLTGSSAYAGATTVGAGTLSLTGSLAGATAIATAAGATFTESSAGTIGGTASVTNSGTTILNGVNSYSGGTNVKFGTLQFGKITSMPASGAVTVGSSNSAAPATLAVNVGGSGEFTNATSGNGSIGGLDAGVGGQGTSTVVFNNGSALGLDTTNAGGTFTYSGIIANQSQSLGLTKLGTGTLVLNAANTFGGIMNLAGGTVNAPIGGNANGSLGSFNTITFTGGNLQYAGTNAQDYSSRIQDSTGAISIDTNGKAITFGNVLSAANTGGLILNDTAATQGALTLSGANLYTGTTTVSAGTLGLNAVHADGTGALAVTSGKVTTGVTGALGGGAVTLTNGILQNTLIASGGTANNVQTSSNLTIASGVATLDFGLNNQGAKFTFTNALPDTFGGILNIVNYTGNPFNPATLEAAAGGGLDQLFFAPDVEHQLTQVYFINPSGITGTYQGRLLASGEVVAPEPSQWLAFAVGMLGLGGLSFKARRHRRVPRATT